MDAVGETLLKEHTAHSVPWIPALGVSAGLEAGM
jgi:hypothetical protein